MLNAQNVTINGFIKDSNTGENLLFASCVDSVTKTGVSANEFGHFSITLPRGNVILIASYIGYENSVYTLYIENDTTIVFSLNQKANEIDELVINAYQPVKEQVLMGKTNVPVKTIKAIPSFFGEPDVMKALTFIPGVTTGRDGYSNIHVRGGDRGQNLILHDGIKLYNTNHIGGFISLFNSDVIKHVDLYKSGFPAHYGGSASSVIDIFTKDGNASRVIGGKVNIGIFNLGLLLEGGKNSITYLFAARSSYFHLFQLPAKRDFKRNGEGEYATYNLFDLNGKISWQPSTKVKLSISAFTGQDHQKAVENTGERYTERRSEREDKIKTISSGVSITATNIISPKLFWLNSLAYSTYNQSSDEKNTENRYGSVFTQNNTSSSKINDISYNSRFDLYANNRNRIKIGIETSLYRFVPGVQTAYYENINAASIADTVIGIKETIKP